MTDTLIEPVASTTPGLNEKMQLLDTEMHLIEGFEPQGEKDKHFYIRGKFATIETVNNNGRIYPRDLWEREVARYQEEIKNGTINTLMEWDHPKDRLEVDPSKAIAKITKLWIEGNFVMGEAIIFDVPMAETLKSLIKYGVQLSVSSRARGRTNTQGLVQEFELITFDFVAKPSDTAATMYGIFENFNEGNIMNDELLESMVGMVRTKDTEIQDLKDEVLIWKERLNEAKEALQTQTLTEGTQMQNPQTQDNDKIKQLNEEVQVWRDRFIQTNEKLNEAAIGNFALDPQVISRVNYTQDIFDEEQQYDMRTAASPLAQTHRHQDVALLRDTDPASSSFSGEDEVTRIAKLLVQALVQAVGRANDVGTRLDRDIDTGRTIKRYAAGIEDILRPAQNGLDAVQLRNLGMTESKSFIA